MKAEAVKEIEAIKAKKKIKTIKAMKEMKADKAMKEMKAIKAVKEMEAIKATKKMKTIKAMKGSPGGGHGLASRAGIDLFTNTSQRSASTSTTARPPEYPPLRENHGGRHCQRAGS